MLTLLSKLKWYWMHENYRYYTSFMEDDSMHIVMEYAEKGDLYRVISFLNLTYSKVIERVTIKKEILFWKRFMGFLLSNLYSYRIFTF